MSGRPLRPERATLSLHRAVVEKLWVDRFGSCAAKRTAGSSVSAREETNWERKLYYLLTPALMGDPSYARVESELRQRDLTQVPTCRLHSLADSLRRQLARETSAVRFLSPVNSIPADELVEQVQEWNP